MAAKKMVKVEVEVDAGQFLEDLGGVEICRRQHCGYFLKYVDEKPGRNEVLVWEFEEPSSNGIGHTKAINAFHAGSELPKHYHRINEEFMLKAFVEGCKKYGADWYGRGDDDANTYDRVFQLALFGEQKYA